MNRPFFRSSIVEIEDEFAKRKIGDNILKQKNLDNYNKSGKIYVSLVGKIIQTILSF